MNIMIASLSPVIGEKGEIKYWYGNKEDKYVEGIQTNEAATKYFIKYLSDKGESLDRILYLVSNKVKTEKSAVYRGEEEKITSENFYKKRIEEYCKENNYKIPKNFFKPFDVDESNRIPDRLLEEINDINKNNELTVFIDTTGGPRTTSTILQLLIKFLTYKNIKVGMALYSDIIIQINKVENETKKIGKIQMVDTYDVLRVLDGVNQFVTTGQCSILQEAFKEEDTPEIKALLSTMESFTNEILLCQTDKLDSILSNMKKQLIDVERNKFEKNTLILFSQFIPIIREKFFGSSDRESTDYISITRWCIDNGLIQQALTIYTEKIPVFILNKIISKYKFTETKKKKLKPNSSKEASVLYEDLLDMQTEEDLAINELKRKNMRDLSVSQILEIENICIDRLKKAINASRVVEKSQHIDFSKFLRICKENNSPKNCKKIVEIIKKGETTFNTIVDFSMIKNVDPNIDDIIRAAYEEVDLDKKFINRIINNEDSLRAFLNFPAKVKNTIQKKLITIDNIEIFVKSSAITLREEVKKNDLQNILRDYLYVKTVRNMINHALENQEDNGEWSQIFNSEIGKKFNDIYELYDNEKKCFSIGIAKIAKNMENGIKLLGKYNK